MMRMKPFCDGSFFGTDFCVDDDDQAFFDGSLYAIYGFFVRNSSVRQASLPSPLGSRGSFMQPAAKRLGLHYIIFILQYTIFILSLFYIMLSLYHIIFSVLYIILLLYYIYITLSLY